MRKLFGYCLLNAAEVEELADALGDVGTALTRATRERRQLEERIETLEARLSNIRTTKIDVIARRRRGEDQYRYE